MSETDLTTFRAIIVDICDKSFPQEWNEKTWALCRVYVGQVMGPLMDPEISETKESASVMDRVGWFLRGDGKMIDSEQLLVRSFEISLQILGVEHPDTLTSMTNLSITYWAQGRTGKEAALPERLLEKCRWILGADHTDTLTSMNNLVLASGQDGRGGGLAGGCAGEAQANNWSRASRHAEVDEQPREYVLRSGQDEGGGDLAGGGPGEAKADLWSRASRHADVNGQPCSHVLRRSGQDGRGGGHGRGSAGVAEAILGAEHPDMLMSMNNLSLIYWDQEGGGTRRRCGSGPALTRCGRCAISPSHGRS